MSTPATPTKAAPCNVRVIIREDDDGASTPIHDRTGDHNYGDFRDWIVGTVHWAIRNGKRVTIDPA